MGTTATSVLEQRLAEQINDYIQVVVTTAIAANTSIISTNLTSYDRGANNYFKDWWVYITDKANAGVQRQVSSYTSSSGTLVVRGANLSTDSANLATIRLHRYNRDWYINALNDAIRETSAHLFRYMDVTELVLGNLLPNAHFRDWTSSSNPDKWTTSNVTAAANTTTDYIRGGAKSVKVTASATDGYLYCGYVTNPYLLGVMGKNVTARVWAYPQVANDARIYLYTIKAEGTEQNLYSTTTCPAGKWTLLELSNQSISDDIVQFQYGLQVRTDTKYAYFDNARLIGADVTNYLLPIDFRDGHLAQVILQGGAYSDYPADALLTMDVSEIYGWDIKKDGTDKYLVMPYPYSGGEQLIRLVGDAPLSTVSAYTDTVEISGEQVNLLIAYAKYKLYQMVEGQVSSQEIGRYESQSAKAYG